MFAPLTPVRLGEFKTFCVYTIGRRYSKLSVGSRLCGRKTDGFGMELHPSAFFYFIWFSFFVCYFT